MPPIDNSDDQDKQPNAQALPEIERTLAVALSRYNESADLPRVVAGGQGLVARQILDIAYANGVKVREDADLAQLLTSIDVDSDIPIEAFAAVAEILSYVYQSNQNMAAASDHLTAPADNGHNNTDHNNTPETAADMITKWQRDTHS